MIAHAIATHLGVSRGVGCAKSMGRDPFVAGSNVVKLAVAPALVDVGRGARSIEGMLLKGRRGPLVGSAQLVWWACLIVGGVGLSVVSRLRRVVLYSDDQSLMKSSPLSLAFFTR